MGSEMGIRDSCCTAVTTGSETPFALAMAMMPIRVIAAAVDSKLTAIFSRSPTFPVRVRTFNLPCGVTHTFLSGGHECRIHLLRPLDGKSRTPLDRVAGTPLDLAL